MLLPGVPVDFSASSLPLSLQARRWIDLREGFRPRSRSRPDQEPVAQTQTASEDQSRPTPSVESAAAQLTGEVTAAAFVVELLRIHPEYGERRGDKVAHETTAITGEQATAAQWIDRVRALLKPGSVLELHGRLMIAGLARLDAQLKAQLEASGFLPALEREIREPLDTLFEQDAAAPEETVPTHGDNPATVDLLNREGFGRILAARIVDARKRDADTAKALNDKEFPLGRSFLVLLHGRWGIGKTSVLNFLHGDLRGRKERPWVVVTFNAWQHQRLAPPWWWLTASLYRQAFRELWRISPGRAVLFRVREWLWRLRGGWPGLVCSRLQRC